MSELELTSPSAITAFLERHGLSALKKFGQNFLCDANIVRKIGAATGVGPDDYVLEIGMGLGALTAELSSLAKKVVTVEIDRGLLETRGPALEETGNVRVVEGDILKTDLAAVWRDDFGSQPFYVCGNLPYYITGRILLRVLGCGLPILGFTAMVQKEVAERLSAAPGTSAYGASTAYADYFCHPRTLFTVSRRCFYPAPEVDSAIIRLDLRTKRPDVPYPAYHALVRQAFSMRRKTIVNNLKGLDASIPAREILEACGIDPSLRAQDLDCTQYTALTSAYLSRGWHPADSGSDDSDA